MTYQTTRTYPRRRPVWPWVLAGVLLLLSAMCAITLGGALGDESRRLDAPAPTVSRSAAADPTAPAHTFAGDGSYEVGRDIAVGRYRTPGPSDDNLTGLCAWQIATSSGRTLDTGVTAGVAYLPPSTGATLTGGQVVIVNGCDLFTMV